MPDLGQEIREEIARITLQIDDIKSRVKENMHQPQTVYLLTTKLRQLHVRLNELEKNLRKASLGR
jgi:ATP-dependent Lon protease